MSDIERDIWVSHDRRLSEQDEKIASTQRGVQSIESELHQLIERINHGVSPTQQKILAEAGQIKLSLNDIEHKIAINIEKLDRKIEERFSDVNSTLTSHDEWLKGIKKVFVWGTLAAIVAFGLKAGWDHFLVPYKKYTLETR